MLRGRGTDAAQSRKTNSREAARRKLLLRDLFRRFDLDQSGYVDSEELLVLGQARRARNECHAEV